MTATDTLIHTSQELCAELTAKSSISETDADSQRVRRAVAHAMRKSPRRTPVANNKPQRLPEEEYAISLGTAATDSLTTDDKSTIEQLEEKPVTADDGLRMHRLHVTQPTTREEPPPNAILQDNPPSQRKRSRTQALLSAIELSGSCPSARQAASRTYLLQFLVDYEGTVIDDDTGELLEYRNLI